MTASGRLNGHAAGVQDMVGRLLDLVCWSTPGPSAGAEWLTDFDRVVLPCAAG
jgi:hypothetical protein